MRMMRMGWMRTEDRWKGIERMKRKNILLGGVEGHEAEKKTSQVGDKIGEKDDKEITCPGVR